MTEQMLLKLIVMIIGLLFISSVSSVLLRRIRFPYTIGLVLIGLAIGLGAEFWSALQPFKALKLTPNTILFIFVPTLIFESAFNMDSRLLRRNIVPSMLLAGPGLLVSTVLVAGGTWWVCHQFGLQIGWSMVFLFGALISATDPVAVIALFKDMGAPKRLTLLVEGESVFNDATAIVTFQIVMAIAAAGTVTATTVAGGMMNFVFVFFGGLLVGMLIGYLLIRTLGWIGDQPLVLLTLTMVVAYSSFIFADQLLSVSGVMSVVGSGLVVGWYGPTRLSPDVRKKLGEFWEYMAFIANSLIFLLVGLQEELFLKDLHLFKGLFWLTVSVVGVVFAARLVVVFGLVPMYNLMTRARKIDLSYQIVLFWGGLRGAVALALALSLATDLPYRNLVIDFTLGVAMVTLLVSGTTMNRLLGWLGLDQPPLDEQMLLQYGRAQAHQAALAKLEEQSAVAGIRPELVREHRAVAEAAISKAEAELAQLRDDPCYDAGARYHVMWSQALAIELQAYRSRLDRGLMSEHAFREMESSVCRRQLKICPGQVPESPMPWRGMDDRLANYGLDVLRQWLPGMAPIERAWHQMGLQLYDQAEAIVTAAELVMTELDQIAKFSGADQPAVDACRAYYDKAQFQARQRSALLIEGHKNYDLEHQRLGVHRAMVEAQCDAVERMVNAGQLDEELAESLIGECSKSTEV